MADNSKHYLVDFASRYASARIKTFNAASALWRAQDLLSDIDELIVLSEEAEKNEIRFGGVFPTYEIISYYAIGLVTCLEWHARSRLVDLMLFRPQCIRASDLKGIADLAISQMVASGVTVPHLLGAATKVSSIKEYVAIFERLLREVDSTVDVEKQLRSITVAGRTSGETIYDNLDYLCEYRNHLVHEISYSIVGHHLVRDVWSLSEAKAFARNVIMCIKIVEALITEHTPQDFPNRLNADGMEEDEFDKLQNAISTTEAEISAALATDERGQVMWIEALDAHKLALKKELEFLDSAETLRPVRYYDVRRIMQTELLKSWLAFLLTLKSETGH